VKILGDREMYVKSGTAVTLRCLISNCLEKPAYVFWYHGNRRLLDDEDQIPGDLLPNEDIVTTPDPKNKKKRGKNRQKGSTLITAKPTEGLFEDDLNRAFARGGIKISTRLSIADGSAISTVTIQDPTPAHSGLYACRPANLELSYVNLHVIQGTYKYLESAVARALMFT
jgi:hypothetical protein